MRKRSLNARFLEVWDRSVSGFRRLLKHRCFKVFLVFLLFLLITVTFLIISGTQPVYEGRLYQDTIDPATGRYSEETGKAIAHNYRVFLNDKIKNGIPGILLGFLIPGILLLVFFLYLFFNHRVTHGVFLGFLIAFSIIMRLAYMGITDAVMTRQHDVFVPGNNGHLGLIFHYYYEGRTMPLLGKEGDALWTRFDRSYQLYHPQTAHLLLALFMHVMALFVGENQYLLFQSGKILTTFLSIMIYVLTYLIMKKLSSSRRVIRLSMLMTLFFPTLLIIGCSMNNDVFLIFFVYLSIYEGLLLYERPDVPRFVRAGVAVGLAVGSKLTGALLALPYAVLFLYLIYKEGKERRLKSIIGKCLLFGLIALPLGLYWPIRHAIVDGYPLNYVFLITNRNLLIDRSADVFDRFLGFDLQLLFTSPYLHLGKSPWQDQQLITALIKTQLFGEWRIPEKGLVWATFFLALDLVFCLCLVWLGLLTAREYLKRKEGEKIFYYLLPPLLLVTLSLTFMPPAEKQIQNTLKITPSSPTAMSDWVGLIMLIFLLLILLAFLRKRPPKLNLPFLIQAIIFLLFSLSHVFFNARLPFTPTMDFRYVVPLLLPFAWISAILIDKALLLLQRNKASLQMQIASPGEKCYTSSDQEKGRT